MNDLVSVIIPVYNTAPYLKRCVQSVLQQNWTNFELILVDDGSTDGSGAICDAYARTDSRIRVFHKPNGGVSSARNTGLQNMKGTYFLFLDSDDSFEPQTLHSCMEEAAGGADAVIFGWQELVDGRPVNSGSYHSGIRANPVDMVREILADRHTYGGGYPNKLWRRAAFEANGALPLFSENLFYVEDMEWVIRMLLRAKLVKVAEPIFYNYHLRDDSSSRSEAMSEKRLIGYHDTLARIVEDLAEHSDLQRWFSGIRYTELINSIIDAKCKKQTAVYKALYQKLEGNVWMLLTSRLLPLYMKLRLIAVMTLHTCGLV